MTASAVTAPRALTAYLRRATWGLPPARQQELWDELEEHVLSRADHLILTGLSPTQAMTQAIRELGPPARVTLGMAKVYTMPKLLLAAGTLALAVSAGLYALAGGGGGTIVTLPVFNGSLTKPSCVRGTVPSERDVTVISRSEGDGTTCYLFKREFPAGTLSSFSGTFAGEQTIINLAKGLGLSATVEADGFIKVSTPNCSECLTWRTSGVKDGTRFFPATILLSVITLANQNSVVLTGYPNPSIRTPNTSYSFDRSSGLDLYRFVAFNLVEEFDSSSEIDIGGVARYTHHIKAALPADEVVMLLTRRGKQYTADYAPVGADGMVTIRSASPRIAFTADPTALKRALQDGVSRALLVRVSNIPLLNLKSGIFVPAQATSSAR